jgi:hypothetical protein
MKVGGGMRFHVGRGNNSSLVKQVMTRRWWWKQLEVVEEDEPVNFVWTQLRSLRFSERMPSLMVGQAEEEFTRCHTLIVTANLVQTDTSFKPGKGMV